MGGLVESLLHTSPISVVPIGESVGVPLSTGILFVLVCGSTLSIESYCIQLPLGHTTTLRTKKVLNRPIVFKEITIDWVGFS